MPENRLFATILKKDLNDQEKSVTAYANKSDSIDRSGDLIDDEAWELDNFLKNPVVPAFHMYNRPPIGKALWIKVVPGQGLRFKVQFAKTAEGLEFYELFSGGFLNAFSVGFMGKDWIDREDFTPQDIAKYMRDGNLPSRVYKKVELFEVSAVVVPDHMNALVERSAQGLIKTKEVNDFIEQIKSSKEYIELTEPTEEKAKKIGFIDLETKCDNCEDQNIVESVEVVDSVEKSDTEETPQKPCKQEGGQCMEDCEEYGTCEDEAKKSFESEEVKNEDAIEDKGISDDSEAGLLDIPDNGAGEVGEIVEEKEANLDEIIEKALEEIQENKVENIEEECERIIKLFNSCRTKEVDSELMKKKYGEDFDIEKVKTEPASFEYNIFCKFLGCKIKNLFPTSFFIPSAMMGNYLSAFETVFSKYKMLDQRNFYGNGGEVPLRFSSVQLNSKTSEEFLTDGTRFYETEDKTQKFVTQIYPDWGGVRLDVYTTDKDASVQMNKSFVRDAVVWVKENNLLKGEKFSIHGEFLEKTKKGWDDVIFPSDADKSTIKKNVERLSQNSSGRGIMLIGPPGTGKTMTGKVLMEEDTTFIWASSKDFKYGANSALSLGFELCRELAPSIFFLEDIDTWIQGYTVDLLKTEMDGIRTNKGVLTILTSNFPEDIPEALIDRPGRFHHIINFSLPNKDNRIKLLKFFAENADKDIIEKFAGMTEGFSCSHLKELVDFAKMICEDEGIEIGEALMKSLEQMKEQRQMISDIKAPKKKEFDEEIIAKDIIELKEPEKIDFELKEKTVDIDFDQEEIKSMMKSAILTTVSDSKSMDKLVEERIRRMKGIIDFEDE